jgi:hypothetical protein
MIAVMGSGNPQVLESCFAVLTTLFGSGTDQLHPELLEITIEQLFERQPSVASAIHRAEWNSVVGTAYGMMACRDPQATCRAMPRYIQELLPGKMHPMTARGGWVRVVAWHRGLMCGLSDHLSQALDRLRLS